MRTAIRFVLTMIIFIFATAGCRTPIPDMPALLAGETQTPLADAIQECTDHQTRMTLDGPARSPSIGETFLVTATLSNIGQCASIGMPQYTLMLENDAPSAVLSPDTPEPVGHSLGLNPGDVDQAVFEFQVVSSGVVTITANTSFEVHLGDPGAAYWGWDSTPPLLLGVLGEGAGETELYLPMIRR